MGSRYYTKRLRVRAEKKLRRERKRPKTFKSEDSAKKWAEANKIKDYKLANIGNESRSKIRVLR